jgi:hypothetical protein
MGNSYNITVGKLQGKRALGRPKHILFLSKGMYKTKAE